MGIVCCGASRFNPTDSMTRSETNHEPKSLRVSAGPLHVTFRGLRELDGISAVSRSESPSVCGSQSIAIRGSLRERSIWLRYRFRPREAAVIAPLSGLARAAQSRCDESRRLVSGRTCRQADLRLQDMGG